MQDIKHQFKILSKKYHPDLNSHLSDDAKDRNRQKYVAMVSAYDTLKNVAKKREYDATLSSARSRPRPSSHPGANPRSHFESEYYGEPRYSRSGCRAHTSHSGYSKTRHRVHNFYSGEGPRNSHFTGEHRAHGDRYDVPHFDYNEHLSKLLKFEQRIINKRLSDADREAIIRQLAPDGDISKINEETFTKHLMRQARSSHATSHVRAHVTTSSNNPHMYQGGESSFGMTAALLAGGAGSVYLLYQVLA